MSIKLVVVKTGEQIIAKIEEMILDDRVVGYFLIKPCVVKIEDLNLNKDTGGASFDIKLTPWIPLGKGIRFPVPTDWVVTISEPVDELKLMYQTDILRTTEEIEEQNIVLKDNCEECQ
jgi:hypothetical protein